MDDLERLTGEAMPAATLGAALGAGGGLLWVAADWLFWMQGWAVFGRLGAEGFAPPDLSPTGLLHVLVFLPFSLGWLIAGGAQWTGGALMALSVLFGLLLGAAVGGALALGLRARVAVALLLVGVAGSVLSVTGR